MKTICLLMDSNDRAWVKDYLKANSATEEITIVAPSFEGRLVAEESNIPYKTYEELAWNLDKNDLYTRAREMAYRWHQIPELSDNLYLSEVRNYGEYPLLTMHQSGLLIIFNEIFQAFEFVKKIFDIERPEKVVFGKRNSPFLKHLCFMVTCSNGLEREVAKSLCLNRGISFLEMCSSRNLCITNKIFDLIKTPRRLFDKVIRPLVSNVFKSTLNKQNSINNWADGQNGPKILIFAWADYYLSQLSEIFDRLIEDGARVALVIVGGVLTGKQKKMFEQNGVCVCRKSDWSDNSERQLLKDWKKKGAEAFCSLEDCAALKSYFSDNGESFFSELVSDALKQELTAKVPITVREIARAERIIDTFNPDLVISHFAMHPLESCDVLPARLKGIPTLSLTHGIPGYTGSERDTISTEYYAVEGDAYREALLSSVKIPQDSVIAVGQSRLEKISCSSDVKEWKKFFGLNPDKPLCIFCDHSVWSIEVDYRHSTFKTVEQLLNLKTRFPDLQIIFRFHHGTDYTYMQRYFEGLSLPGVIFQVSPSPLFTEIVKAADFVISHHTSAITEALLSGVRVIYLCALSDPEPLYYNYDAISVADSWDILPELVRKIIEHPMLRDDVVTMAQPYFDRVLCGNDGKAGERLANLVMKLSRTAKFKRNFGFQDWVNRIEASCSFQSGDWKVLRKVS